MIRVVDLHKSFGDKKVLDGVNLEINDCESVVVIGGSGSGKSVLIKNVIGLMKPDKGSVFIDDVDIAGIDNMDKLNEIRKKFGMLFQYAALFDSMKVWENVAFALLRLHRLSEYEARAIAIEKLKSVGLVDVEDLMPAELSGGMKKRVGLARAIAHDPEILIFDEPTTGLDPIMADVIDRLIISVRKELKATSITITHDMNSAYRTADRIAMLYNGKIIETGTPEEIRNTGNPTVRQFIEGRAEGPIHIEGAGNGKSLGRV
ncbi:L-cystine import ATP-binding protein TcyN [bacterium BMS3Bbin05]|nr:L-cystine import ATP-binding protein TcyN [bacterium BMS3Bbin05]HDL20065.1 ABC transporter ATP-binding protein [Nitrospirota bacterium]HDO21478.1 ABC transporter ATP-binding protein [Nitrospirota bacterium]